MSEAYRGLLRASMESTLVRHIDALRQQSMETRSGRVLEMLSDENIAADVACLNGDLLPLYWRGLNHIRSPLLRLPPELIRLILLAVTAGQPRWLRPWLYMGHICHDLRSALLGMHVLWAGVVYDSRYARGYDELLNRAGNVPIIIYMTPRTPEEHFNRAFALLSRARIISLDYSLRERVAVIIEALRRGPHHVLEELRVRLAIFEEPLLSQDSPLLSPDLPNLIVPRLRVLELKDVFVPVDMSRLSELTLEWTRPAPTPIPDACAFVDMLCYCSNLTVLVLDGWIPECDALQRLHQEGRRITLHRLAHLGLRQDMPHMAAFWNIVVMPQSATLSVNAVVEEPCDLDGLRDHTRSLRTLVAHTQVGGLSKISKLAACKLQDQILEIRLGAADEEQPATPELASRPRHPPLVSWKTFNSCFSLTVSTNISRPNEVAKFLKCLFENLKMRVENIDTLHLSLDDGCFSLQPTDDQYGYSLHTMFPAIAVLDLHGFDEDDVAHILDASSARGCHYHPRVQALFIHDAFSPEIADAVERRVKYGDGILQVITVDEYSLSSCYFGVDETTRNLKRLKAVVPHVHVVPPWFIH
ncbi:unnamed protein product [Peniophora sp. CBMAI 1063]|nr:unnamed protein product [Peniophora sp. CBMAI 1063]